MPGIGLIIQIGIVVGLLAIVYFLYSYTSAPRVSPTLVVGSQISGVATPPVIGSIPMPFEGGDYTVSFWVYINGYSVNRESRKHIISIGGSNFSTVFIALGAFKNTLVVRTHSRDSNSSTYSPSPSGSASGSSIEPRWNSGTPGSQMLTDGSLNKSDVTKLLSPMALDDSILDNNSVCDLTAIDFQRWVQVTVVLSGRTIDVYMDGKLSRSCVTGSYFKVDPTGIKATLLENGGFDGYLSKVQLASVALNPSDIYQLYTAGP